MNPRAKSAHDLAAWTVAIAVLAGVPPLEALPMRVAEVAARVRRKVTQ